MNFLKNRTVLGVICIAIALVICFLITPLFNASASKTTEIIRMKNDVKVGQEITEKDIETVEVGAYNLPSDVIRSKDEIVGKYVASELVKGEYVLPSKISDTPANENNYLYGLTDGIVSCLAENSAIQKMYYEWCELEREKYFTYTGAVKSFPTLAENKVFKPIKNCVINTVLNMSYTLDSPECEIEKDTDKTKERLEFSAAAGNEYAKNLLENMDRYKRSAVQSAAASLLNSLGRMLYEDYSRNTQSRHITEHKLQNAIRRKKLALGIKDDQTVDREVKLLENQ